MTVLGLLFLVVYAGCYAVSAIYYYHMFQLNSYKAGKQISWLRANAAKGYLLRNIIAALALPLLLLPPLPLAVAAMVLYLWQGWANRPKPAKKPLVYTMRVRRMLITNAVLLAAAMVLTRLLLSWKGQVGLLTLFFLLSPLWVLASNLINTPVERAINQWYINDAKRIIRQSPGLIVIGITGSYGKTSAKYFLNKLLSSKYNVLMTPESFNTTLGVVKTVREQLKPIHEIFICEMGAKGVGEIKEICDIVLPRYGLITSIGPQHLETFHSIENIIKTKFELADAVPGDGAVFLNYDNEYIRKNPCGKTVISYGLEEGRYRGHSVQASNNGSRFTVKSEGWEETFETRLLGAHNVQNLVGCIAVADYLGVNPKDIAVSVRRLESVPHRLQLINRGGNIIIDDAFNSNTSGAKAALDALSMFDGYKILVTPGMIELGDKQDEYNRNFGRQAAEVCDFVVLMGKRQTEPIHQGLTDCGYPEEHIFVAESLSDAFARIGAINAGGKQKVILLENDLPDNY